MWKENIGKQQQWLKWLKSMWDKLLANSCLRGTCFVAPLTRLSPLNQGFDERLSPGKEPGWNNETLKFWSSVPSRFGKSPRPQEASASFQHISTIFNYFQLFSTIFNYFQLFNWSQNCLSHTVCRLSSIRHFSNFFRMATLSFADGMAQGMVIASAQDISW